MSVIRDLLNRLGSLGVDAEFFNNGGGAMVIRAAFGDWVPNESNRRYEVLITEREDSFEMYSDDEDMSGLLACLYVNNDEGESAEFVESCGPVVLYRSRDNLISVNECVENEYAYGSMPEGFSVVSMSTEIRECADAVAFAVDRVRHADHIARRTLSRSRHWMVDTPDRRLRCEVCGVGCESEWENW